MLRIITASLLPLVATALAGIGAAQEGNSRQIAGWGEVINPRGDCRVVEQQGTLSITVPGTYHDLIDTPGFNNMDAPRVLQNVQGDFVVQVRIPKYQRPQARTAANLQSPHSYVSCGLLVWQDAENYLRYQRAANGDSGFVGTHANFFAGNRAVANSGFRLPDTDTWLRIERKDGRFTLSQSTDGRTWNTVRPQGDDLTLADRVQVGVFVVNATNRRITHQFCEFSLKQSMPQAAGPGVQGTGLRQAIGSLAMEASNQLMATGDETVSIGTFEGPAATSGGQRIRKQLMDQLTAQGIRPADGERMILSGRFEMIQQDGEVRLRLVCRLDDTRSDRDVTFRERTVNDTEDMVALLGPTVPKLPAEDPDLSAGERLAVAIQKPAFDLEGTLVSVGPGSPYRVELLADGRPCAIEDRQGLAYAAIDVGQNWAVRLVNESEYDCAVRLTIDGLNCFEFSEVPEYRRLGLWILRRRSQVIIPGWYIREGERDLFTVVPAADSVLARLGGHPAAIGTITCEYFAAWRPDEPRPPIEPAMARRIGDEGTARGPRIAGQPEQRVRRFIGQTLQSVVSIRYSRPE